LGSLIVISCLPFFILATVFFVCWVGCHGIKFTRAFGCKYEH
jgi:hypothetical protein